MPGNRGRLLDARRTPIAIVGLHRELGTFELEIRAFEDQGARWQLPFEDVSRFQFERGSATLDAGDRQELERISRRFDRLIEVPATAEARAATLRAVERERSEVRSRVPAGLDLSELVERRRGSPAASAALRPLMEERGLQTLEDSFARSFVSNPASGEVVKGHAIVLAEMGLCPYAGKVVRDPALFDGERARERRRAHIVLRLAFVRELFGTESVVVYRAVASDTALEPPRAASFVSASFSREVAMSHFEGGVTTRAALLTRRLVPVSRLFMTFVETEAMNEKYREAEAVLIGGPADGAF